MRKRSAQLKWQKAVSYTKQKEGKQQQKCAFSQGVCVCPRVTAWRTQLLANIAAWLPWPTLSTKLSFKWLPVSPFHLCFSSFSSSHLGFFSHPFFSCLWQMDWHTHTWYLTSCTNTFKDGETGTDLHRNTVIIAFYIIMWFVAMSVVTYVRFMSGLCVKDIIQQVFSVIPVQSYHRQRHIALNWNIILLCTQIIRHVPNI